MDSWEPPVAGTDEEHLVGALERLRMTFRWKANGLDAAGLQQTAGSARIRRTAGDRSAELFQQADSEGDDEDRDHQR